ncbi:MAG: hypothetical protein IAE80_15980 [Anaerolinea sp.]|nr:hypothetical protein [Anaerolinea sp.]
MSEDTRPALRRAFDAVEAGELDAARGILEPILAEEPDNADAWWIYSHAVTTPEEAMTALENVVRIDPNYQQASELLDTLRQRLPRRPAIQPLAAPTPAPEPPPLPEDVPDLPPAAEPDFELDETPKRSERISVADEPDLFAEEKTEQPEEEPRRGSLLPILAGVLLVAVIVILLLSVLSQPTAVTPTATPTAVAFASPEAVSPLVTDEPTEDATGDAQVVETSEADLPTEEAAATEAVADSPTPEVSSEETAEAPIATVEPDVESTGEAVVTGMDALTAGLGRYTLGAEAVVEEETTLGRTLIVNVCAPDRREVTALLRPVMRAIARGASAVDSDAVGVRMLNCETGAPFVTMAVDRQSAVEHAAGTLSYVDFRDLWEPQR